MKRFMLIAMALMFSIAMYAQDEVTQFLGIPVDGSKSEMMQKLKAKGFRTTTYNPDILEGEFNGTDVYVIVVTNNNRVWRIMVCDVNRIDETAIRIRFNRLCRQFENNSKYYVPEDYYISDDEDIAYEINVHKKRYEAIFYQRPIIGCDNRPVWFKISDYSGKYYISMYYDNEFNCANGEDL